MAQNQAGAVKEDLILAVVTSFGHVMDQFEKFCLMQRTSKVSMTTVQ